MYGTISQYKNLWLERSQAPVGRPLLFVTWVDVSIKLTYEHLCLSPQAIVAVRHNWTWKGTSFYSRCCTTETHNPPGKLLGTRAAVVEPSSVICTILYKAQGTAWKRKPKEFKTRLCGNFLRVKIVHPAREAPDDSRSPKLKHYLHERAWGKIHEPHEQTTQESQEVNEMNKTGSPLPKKLQTQ